MGKKGLFVGMLTVDLVYLTASFPSPNQKIAATDYTVSAGGPATNAAVTFSYLGQEAIVLTVAGNHPINGLIRNDLDNYKVAIADLDPARTEAPPVSSIIVTQTTGDRAVVSLNASKAQAGVNQIPGNILQGVDIVLIDGHQIEVSCAIAQQAKINNIPIVIDGGSWKPGLENILPMVDYAICSDNFYPPNCDNSEQVFSYLSNIGIPHIAITRGEKPILYLSPTENGEIEIPQINPIDTLGAGDIFHGAFCHYILQNSLRESLTAAAKIASYSCQFFGTRRWMEEGMS
ncbi:MAG TPA: ribokinase [Cyanobacteria bacterium UBA11372]|nr:ribokinase [Cyanobacteria bacterium UBA11372]